MPPRFLSTLIAPLVLATIPALADDPPAAKDKGKNEPAAEAARAPEDLLGLWEGTLKIGALELRLVLDVSRDDEGIPRARLDSPDQGAKGIAITSLELDGDALTFASKSINARFEGKRTEAGDAFAGRFIQGIRIPLTLKKTEAIAERPRPQLPKPPFPYRADEVSYRNEAADLTLAGTLTLPEGDGPFPAVLLITGSGAQDRDETLLGHKPFLVIADHLTRKGVAVLRVDDRGVGGSTGSMKSATSADFATDVEAGLDFLTGRPEIDPNRIGLVGHSEGGVIAPMVAARRDDVAFIVLLAGTGLPGDQILLLQTRLISQQMGVNPVAVAINQALLRGAIAAARGQADPDAKPDPRAEAAARQAAKALGQAGDEEDDDKSGAGGTLGQLRTPWFRYFMDYDPRPALAKVRCPVLALNGENDLQVPPKENLPEIEKALKAGGNDRVTIRELPGLNHLFQTSKTGAPGEYGRIEETFAPAALEVMSDWILEQIQVP